MATVTTLPAHEAGWSTPLGATLMPGGAGFSLFSRSATSVSLLFFDREDDARPSREIALDAAHHRTYHYWHTFVPDVRPGQIYAYRVAGPSDPASGLRFDATKVLLDPYGREVVVPSGYTPDAARGRGDNAAVAMKSVVIDTASYNWEGDAPLRIPSARTIVYEMHVRGFTQHPSSGVRRAVRGTYAGLIEKIPYLQALGITAVELLPVFQFDAQACPAGLVNYWGYQPVSFFAPHRAFSSRRAAGGPTNEFRDMVKALHRAGIEVILDVVFNHTAESGADGPMIGLRGIDNPTYYVLQQERACYCDYTGCGNTLNANNPVVRRMIVDSLRYWVTEMHVDGFRFDLASILSRDSSGQPLADPPVLWDIETDPVLAGTKLIAEAWDAAGLYQVGTFVGDAWKEWNGRFRDDCRDFFRGASGVVGRFADRLLGSPDVYGQSSREPEQSVNFVTCHDGFTLNDLVSYNDKHNEANGEQNRDGANDNRSWNCGVEGPSSDPAVEALRNRQVKNLLTVNLVALGVPMILMGDEVRRTQGGNNNAYCHDDESTWFDWSLVEKHADVHRFVRMLAARRLWRDDERESLRTTLTQLLAQSSLTWHGVALGHPDWNDNSHSIALAVEKHGVALYCIFNAYWEPLDFALPPVAGAWRRWLDTSLASPEDIVEWTEAPPVPSTSYRAAPRSVVVLYAR